jgi:hypothetical protein
MTDVTISGIEDDEKREDALRAEELGERIFNILDEEKSYFVQLNAIAACLAVTLYGVTMPSYWFGCLVTRSCVT